MIKIHNVTHKFGAENVTEIVCSAQVFKLSFLSTELRPGHYRQPRLRFHVQCTELYSYFPLEGFFPRSNDTPYKL